MKPSRTLVPKNKVVESEERSIQGKNIHVPDALALTIFENLDHF